MDQLTPITEIINDAKALGVTFGHGDPKTHLAYLTKLRLLPQTIRRKIGQDIVGCYPKFVVPLLKKIETMKDAGLTYSQIKIRLQESGSSPFESFSVNSNIDLSTSRPFSLSSLSAGRQAFSFPSSRSFDLPSSSSGLAFLIIGLFLGYLIAIINPRQQVPVDVNKITSTVQTPIDTTTVSGTNLDPNTQAVIKMVNSQKLTNEEKGNIYVISLPQKQSFSKLDQTNMNSLMQ